MKKTRIEQQINFLIEIDKMKSILRQTLLIDKSRQESDAEHSWHFAMTAMILCEYADSSKINILRVLKMALIHDLVEIYAGDALAYDVSKQEKSKELEKNAADKLFSLLPSDQANEIKELWIEFDSKETYDAKYASAIDALQPLLNNYHTQGKMWKLNNVKSGQVYKRQEILKDTMPKLYIYVEEIIKDAIKKGYLAE